MKETDFTIVSNRQIAAQTMQLVLQGDFSGGERPGRFVNLRLEGFYLRRPLSVCDAAEGAVTLVYKRVGRGTEALARLEPGTRLNALTGLGNGFDTCKSGETPLLLGGGAGVAPLYLLARRLSEAGRHVTAVLGFNRADEVFYRERFEALGVRTVVTTADGSAGSRGFVTDALEGLDAPSYSYACGPEPMLRAVYSALGCDGQFSFEERMGCGFGACMGCTCETLYGNKRICRDGPVLERGEIKWPS